MTNSQFNKGTKAKVIRHGYSVPVGRRGFVVQDQGFGWVVFGWENEYGNVDCQSLPIEILEVIK